MLDLPIVLGIDSPNREAFVVFLSVVLLDCRACVVDTTLLIQELALMNVAKHSKVKLFKDREVVLAVLHSPTCVCLAVGDCAVVKGNVDLVWV